MRPRRRPSRPPWCRNRSAWIGARQRRRRNCLFCGRGTKELRKVSLIIRRTILTRPRSGPRGNPPSSLPEVKAKRRKFLPAALKVRRKNVLCHSGCRRTNNDICFTALESPHKIRHLKEKMNTFQSPSPNAGNGTLHRRAEGDENKSGANGARIPQAERSGAANASYTKA